MSENQIEDFKNAEIMAGDPPYTTTIDPQSSAPEQPRQPDSDLPSGASSRYWKADQASIGQTPFKHDIVANGDIKCDESLSPRYNERARVDNPVTTFNNDQDPDIAADNTPSEPDIQRTTNYPSIMC
jgi:hypothetical protein